MNKNNFSALLCSIFISGLSFGQDFLGINTGNYAGVTGLSLQPAGIVDSRHQFDINLFSTGINYSNNYLLVNREAILKFNKKNYENYSSFKQRYLSESNLSSGEKVFFNINNRVQLPFSFMATTGKRSAIALNMQLRSVVQGRGISANLAKMAYNNFYYPPLNNSSIDASGIAVDALNWASAGFTYGRVLVDADKHFLKAAFTAKYLAGVASVNFSSDDLTMQVNTDSTFNFTTSLFNYNHNKNANYDIILDKKFKPDATAFGFDAGLVYEYRGKLDNFKYIRNDDERSYAANRRDVNKYIFKLGISILDAGRFTFDKPANVNAFSANINNWDLKNANYGSLSQFDTALANRVLADANDTRSYLVYLPTAWSVQADIRFVKGLFLNIMSYQPLKMGSTAGRRFNNYGYFAVTPRYERRHFGIYIPYSIAKRNAFSADKDHALGLSLRAGPLFIGSSNLGTMAFKQQLRSADVYLGLKVGITYGKPNKANRLIEKTFAKPTTASVPPNATIPANRGDTGRLLLNYKDGNVFEPADKVGNIIIINNYYYGTEKQRADTLTNLSAAVTPVAVGISSATDAGVATSKMMDSISKLTADSLQQKRGKMDRLIRSLQQLQQRMDSTLERAAKRNAVLRSSSSPTLDTAKLRPQPARAIDSTGAFYQPGQFRDTLPAAQHPQQSASSKDPRYEVDKQLARLQAEEEKRRQQQYDALQQSFNRQYEQYASQAASLSKDIERLNDQLADPRRYYETRSRYIPSYDYRQPYIVTQPGEITNLVKNDTTYVRDTLVLSDTVLVRADTMKAARAPLVRKETAAVDYGSIPAAIVLFAVNATELQPIYHDRLKYFASLMAADSSLAVRVTGHTDPTGPAAVNKKLSRLRADAVTAFLVVHGVSLKRILQQSLGASDPAVAGTDPVANQQNRRVEVKLVKAVQ